MRASSSFAVRLAVPLARRTLACKSSRMRHDPTLLGERWQPERGMHEFHEAQCAESCHPANLALIRCLNPAGVQKMDKIASIELVSAAA
jgi:hypothetical protein